MLTQTPFLLVFKGENYEHLRSFVSYESAELAARQRQAESFNPCSWDIYNIQDLIDSTNPKDYERRIWLREWLG